MEPEDELPAEIDSEEIPEQNEHHSNSMLLIVIQLTVSAILIIASIVIKMIGGTVHSELGTWYYKNYNNTIFLDSAQSFLPFADNITLTETSTAVPDSALAKELVKENSSQAEIKK